MLEGDSGGRGGNGGGVHDIGRRYIVAGGQRALYRVCLAGRWDDIFEGGRDLPFDTARKYWPGAMWPGVVVTGEGCKHLRTSVVAMLGIGSGDMVLSHRVLLPYTG